MFKKIYEYVEKLESDNKRMREALTLIKTDTYAEEDVEEYVSVKHVIRKRAEKALEETK